jgi:hypothetical protein
MLHQKSEQVAKTGFQNSSSARFIPADLLHE